MRQMGPVELKRIRKERVLSLLNESRTLAELENNLQIIGDKYLSEQFSEADLVEFQNAYGLIEMKLQVKEFIHKINFFDGDVAALDAYYQQTILPVSKCLSENDAFLVQYTYDFMRLELEAKNNNAAVLSDSNESEQLQKQLICDIQSSSDLATPTQSDTDLALGSENENKKGDRTGKKSNGNKKPVTSPFFNERAKPALMRINEYDYRPEVKKGCCVLS